MHKGGLVLENGNGKEEKEDIEEDIDMDNKDGSIIVPEYKFDYDTVHQSDSKQRMNEKYWVRL